MTVSDAAFSPPTSHSQIDFLLLFLLHTFGIITQIQSFGVIFNSSSFFPFSAQWLPNGPKCLPHPLLISVLQRCERARGQGVRTCSALAWPVAVAAPPFSLHDSCQPVTHTVTHHLLLWSESQGPARSYSCPPQPPPMVLYTGVTGPWDTGPPLSWLGSPAQVVASMSTGKRMLSNRWPWLIRCFLRGSEIAGFEGICRHQHGQE